MAQDRLNDIQTAWSKIFKLDKRPVLDVLIERLNRGERTVHKKLSGEVPMAKKEIDIFLEELKLPKE